MFFSLIVPLKPLANCKRFLWCNIGFNGTDDACIISVIYTSEACITSVNNTGKVGEHFWFITGNACIIGISEVCSDTK
jgi:hypothetical protein